ncbi:MAG TPA: RDD family protein [Pyrinomonadaceae bacterium]|nr:RDD family protein [Pyrinomonadaceae bacterium]
MSANIERKIPISQSRSQEVVVDFDPEKLKAPFTLRCGALIIDYIFLVSIPIITILIGRMMGTDGAKLLNSELSNAGWLITILLGITNFMIFPMFAGQSLGKMLTGLRVVKSNGEIPSFKNLILRHFLGYPITILTGGLGFLFCILNSKGRALHDYIAGTELIYGQKRIKE